MGYIELHDCHSDNVMKLMKLGKTKRYQNTTKHIACVIWAFMEYKPLFLVKDFGLVMYCSRTDIYP